MSDAGIKTAERRPEEGQRVIGYWPASILGEASMDTVEYHYLPARHELNARIWHRPGHPEEDYIEPERWWPMPQVPAPNSLEGRP